VVKNLPNNCEALSLNPSTTKKKKKSLNWMSYVHSCMATATYLTLQ
jgi:hypothetical protein